MAPDLLSLPPEVRQMILAFTVFENSICFDSNPANVQEDDLISVSLAKKQIDDEVEQLIRLHARRAERACVRLYDPQTLADFVTDSSRYLDALQRDGQGRTTLGISKLQLAVLRTDDDDEEDGEEEDDRSGDEGEAENQIIDGSGPDASALYEIHIANPNMDWPRRFLAAQRYFFGQNRDKFFDNLERRNIHDLPEDDRSCSICYQDYGADEASANEGEAILVLPCKHVFGEGCLRRWLSDNDHCPYCRRQYALDSQGGGVIDDHESEYSMDDPDDEDPVEVVLNTRWYPILAFVVRGRTVAVDISDADPAEELEDEDEDEEEQILDEYEDSFNCWIFLTGLKSLRYEQFPQSPRARAFKDCAKDRRRRQPATAGEQLDSEIPGVCEAPAGWHAHCVAHHLELR
ncbi:hypothetical protein LTR65_004884 [Meristemomyces frigidus]